MLWFMLKPFIVVFVFIFSLSSMADTEYPFKIVDALGKVIVIEKEPKRIASKTLFSDEVLLELLDERSLSSLTDLANNPNYSAIKNPLPKSVPLVGLNVEMIIAERPDIVFVANWSDAAKLLIIENAGIPVYRILMPTNIAEITAEITRIGKILNKRNAADKITEKMQLQLAQQLITPEKKLLALDYNPWGTSSGQDSTWDEILIRAQLKNALTGQVGDKYGQVPVSKEMVIALNPDVLFIPSWVYGDDNGAEKFKQQILSDPALQSVSAIREGRVYQVPHALKSSYSQYIIDAIIFVNNVVYKTF